MSSDDRQESKEVPELVLDDKSLKGFIQWFKSLPQDPQLVRFFDRKGFYSVHGDNALMIARQFYKTTAVVKYLGGGDSSLPGVTLNRNLYETVLRDLLLEGAENTVELYEGAGTSWKVTRTASPGKLGQFEEELFRNADMSDMPVVAAVAVQMIEGQRTVGVAYVEAGTRTLGACEFVDDDQFCNLESVLMQLGVKECVISKEGDSTNSGQLSADGRRLRDVLARCNAMASERQKSVYSIKDLESDVARLVKGGSVEQHRDVLERKVAASALAAVLHFTELKADSTNHGKWYLTLYDAGRYMRLDAAAQRALSVLPSRLDANNNFSLYGLMNRARTPAGKRKLKAWLKQPLVDLDEIRVRHDVVEALVGDSELRDKLRDQHFRGLPDVERLTRKLEAGKVGLADLCQLYRCSAKLPLVEEAFRCHLGPHAALLVDRYAEVLAVSHNAEHLTKFEELLEAAIDLERIPEEYLICATYDPRLEKLRAEKDEIEARIDRLAQDAANDLGLQLDKSIKLEWHKFNNTRTRCLRITQKEEKAVRGKLNAKYMTLETRKDGTKFTSKSMKECADRLNAISSQYEGTQKELVEQVVSVARTFAEVWEGVAALLAELDVLLAFADLAVHAPHPYVRPVMLPGDAGEVVLVGSRHPCVEAQEGVDFIKNDCNMVAGESWFQIITGPNMGGKSTFIRQVGVCVLMAQVGCFVPCDEARIAVRDAIFARVGAGDCQLRGVSTFMAEMLETAAILKGASSRSLVIIDELGRGTSTYDGLGLAWAISEQLMNAIAAPTLFATHFHELTEITGPGGVRNLHVETVIDPSSGALTMLYRIKEGACDQSFGIHVAESAAFPQAVVAAAKKKLEELEGGADPAANMGALQIKGVGVKRKREEVEVEESAALVAVDEFLDAFAALPLAAMQQAEAFEAVAALHTGLQRQAADNPELLALLGAAVPAC